jgi:hypothetical protein
MRTNDGDDRQTDHRHDREDDDDVPDPAPTTLVAAHRVP